MVSISELSQLLRNGLDLTLMSTIVLRLERGIQAELEELSRQSSTGFGSHAVVLTGKV